MPLVKRIIGLIGALCVGLIVIDLWLRAHPTEVPLPIKPNAIKIPADLVQADPTLGYHFRPNATRFFMSANDEFSVNYQISEIGLRDSGMIAAIKGSPRVLVLGDAFVEGWGMMGDVTFLREVQRELRTTEGIHPYTRLLNAGMSGFGAAQSFLLSQRVNQTFKPDMILFVYTSLMPVADHRFLATAALDENGIAVSFKQNEADLAPIANSRKSVLEISALYQIAQRYLAAKAAYQLLVRGDPDTDLFAAARGLNDNVVQLHERSLQHVRAIAEFADEQNMKFILLHIPLPHQVAADEWADGRRGFGFGPHTYDAPETEIVEAYCRTNQWQCVMSTPMLRKLAEQRSSAVYFRHDYMLTEVGHRALVALLLDTMKTAVSELPSNTFVR
ncbi:MAG: hypothetical protein ACI9BW_001661 [Gammaproteobacteria bacterium]|jgi:hypothetical protein